MDLLVLAAGMGSRFGGLKQIEPIDADNNFIIDYSVFDAIKAGFDRVVFIIKEENLEIFKSTIGNRLNKIIPVEYVFQKMDFVPGGVKIPENRVKPWGTAHAIYCAKDVISDRFAIINADDFYGLESFKICADFLKSNSDNEFVNVGYLVNNTLSDKGSVKRGIFEIENDNVLSLTESVVERRNNEVWATPLNEDNWKKVPFSTLVSMNMFGFTKKLIDRMEQDIKTFFETENLEKAEFLISDVVNAMMKEKEISLKVLKTPATWYGITYKEDLKEFKQAIEKMKESGIYPKHLY